MSLSKDDETRAKIKGLRVEADRLESELLAANLVATPTPTPTWDGVVHWLTGGKV